MLTNNFYLEVEKLAPIKYSEMEIANGSYDNSGLLVNNHLEVKRALFSLDLSSLAIKKAKQLKVDTIITHHPVIYNPIKKLDIGGENANLLLAIKNNFNLISMHLNLDVVENGIDTELGKVLGNGKFKYINKLDDTAGYGKAFELNETLGNFVKRVRKIFNNGRVIVYGNRKTLLKGGASFCGGGLSYALDYAKDKMGNNQVIVSSDMPHHVILELVEKGFCIVIITHYSAENYGFNKFYERVKQAVNGKVETFYFYDKRFK